MKQKREPYLWWFGKRESGSDSHDEIESDIDNDESNE